MDDRCYAPQVCSAQGACCYECGSEFGAEPPANLREMLCALQFAVTLRQQAIARGAGGRELALVQTKLDEARLWLGEFEFVTMEV